MTNLLCQFFRDDGAATAVEYGLIVAIIAAVLVTALASIGTAMSTNFSTIVAQLQTP